LVGT
jgi:hypothetical protein